jgi:hypothetical protein
MCEVAGGLVSFLYGSDNRERDLDIKGGSWNVNEERWKSNAVPLLYHDFAVSDSAKDLLNELSRYV